MLEEEEDEDIFVNLFDESDSCNFIKVNKYKPTDESTVKRVYLLGRIISKIFNDHEIPYWVTGGTLLGCVRHKGLIPWDDDLDICMMDVYENKLLSLKNIFHGNDLELVEEHFGYRIYHTKESEPCYNYGYPFCDVFLMHENRKKRRLEMKNPNYQALWENEWYIKSDVEPVKAMLYGDFYFKAPNNSIPYLRQMYGDDCLDVGMTHNYDHKTRMYMEREKVDVSDGFHPARPFR